MEANCKVSIIIPAYNEEDIILEALSKIYNVIISNELSAEIICVDDCSSDMTGKIALDFATSHDKVYVITHKKRLGQSFALVTGYNHSNGEIIVFFDADLQYDPNDIPRFVELIVNDNVDLVTGWRTTRASAEPITKRFVASIFNKLCFFFFRIPIHDYNCGFRVLKKEILENIQLREGFHRTILASASSLGYEIAEVPILEYERKTGITKYGFMRLINGSMDLFALKLHLSFFKRPMILFGPAGIIFFIIGLVGAAYLVIKKLVYRINLVDAHLPLIFIVIFLLISGIQFFLLGYLADMLGRLFYNIDELKHRVNDGDD